MSVVVNILLGLAVLAIWLACAGFARLNEPFARLHCVTFVTVAAGVPVLAAAILTDGISDRTLKILALILFSLVSGAAASHATGRAMLIRGHDRHEGDLP